MRATALTIALLATLSGCGEEFLRATSSPAFADGYQDGCTNGSSTASNLTGQSVRDEKRYKADPEYAKGWQDGNRACNGGDLRSNPNHPREPITVEGPDYPTMDPIPIEGPDTQD